MSELSTRLLSRQNIPPVIENYHNTSVPPYNGEQNPIPFSFTKKFRYLLEHSFKYDQFVSKLVGRYGAFSSRFNIDAILPGKGGIAKSGEIDVTYIRRQKTEDQAVQEVIQKTAPSIVQITAWDSGGSRWSGSGAIIDLAEAFPDEKFPPGTYGVLTNNHVVPAGETKYISVSLANGTAISGVKVLRSKNADTGTQDPLIDAAIVVIQSPVPLPTIKIAKDLPENGDTVLAVGHPLGLPKASFTRGVVSHNSQETGEPIFVIQHDAEINPGNSGGPLLNLEGEIMGLNTFSFRGSNGMSFAIPVQTQIEVLRDIYNKGEFVRGDFGFTVSEFTAYDRMKDGFPSGLPGAKISTIDKKSEGYQKGLRPNDIITSILADDGTTINIDIDNGFEVTRFFAWMHKKKPGSTVQMIVYRRITEDGKVAYKPETIEIKVGKLDGGKLANSNIAVAFNESWNTVKGLSEFLAA